MLPPSSDLGIARSHFNKLPLDDINRKYFEGTPYYSPTGFWKKIYHSLFVQPKLFEEVNQFYPYQKVVVGTREEWEM